MILYRPVGLQELALLYDSGMKAFPARLPQQPIFYPVLDLDYARQVASSWNAKNGQLAGYVTQFKVDDYIEQFEEHTVGGSQHQELWIPAEELENFNKHIVGHIKVVEAHFGGAFEGFIPDQFGLQGKNAVEQFTLLANSFVYKRMEFYLELKRNHKAVFLNYPFWLTYAFKNPGLKEKVLQAIKEAWLTSFPKIPLPLPVPDSEGVPAKQRPAPALVDPLEEEITPEEEAEPDPWSDDVDEETILEDERDTDVKPVFLPARDEIKPVKRKPAQVKPPRSLKPVHEEIPPVKPAPVPPPRPRKSVQEEIPPDEEAGSDPSVDPVEDKETDADANSFVEPPKQTPARAQHLTDSVQDEIRRDVPSAARPVEKAIPPIQQSRSHFLGNFLNEKAALPAPVGSHFAQGIKLGLSGEVGAAVNELSRAIQEDPDDATAQTSLGVAFHHLGEDDRALDCYEAALQLDPRSAEAHYFRANILYQRGEVREAIAGYTQAIGLQPELIAAHERPVPEDRLTDYSPAPAEIRRIVKPARHILDLNKELEADPRQANLFKERAAEYARLWNYEQAIADYNSCLALQPQDASAIHSRGLAYEQLGQVEQAQKDYRQASALNSQISDVYIQRGINFGAVGNFRQSIASLTEGIRLAPQNADGYFNRGTAYFQQGDLENAIADFSHVIRLSPGDEGAYYWRGISYEEAGRQQEAIDDYRQFLTLTQDPRAKEEIEQKLSQWNLGKQDDPGAPRLSSPRSLLEWVSRKVRPQSPLLEDLPGTDPAAEEKRDQELDIHTLLVALGERALRSSWFGSGVECYGEKAEQLYALTDQEQPIEGRELLSITAGIEKTIAGDFYALDKGAPSHWLFIRAWEGSGFYVETNDSESRERLKAHFPTAEEVDGASPSYEGLFIRL